MIETTVFFGFLGLMTAIGMWLIATEGDKKYFFPLTVAGLTTGWLTGLVWSYVTGGLSIPLYATTFPVIASIFVSTLILFYLPAPKISGKVESNLAKVAVAVFILLAFFTSYLSIPLTGTTVMETTDYTGITAQSVSTLTVDEEIAEALSTEPTNQIPIEITTLKNTVSPLSTIEDGIVGKYLHFKITFSVSGYDWVKPYVKLLIFKDNDEDGQISKGDTLYTTTNYKVILNSGNWRANVKYVNNLPTEEIFVANIDSEDVYLPIIHGTISVWKDDTKYTFSNTPERYSPPNDMLSWNDNTLMETIQSFEVIPAGSSSSIEGKIYCSEAGKYLMLVEAFDARFSEPFEHYSDEKPISKEIIPFEVKSEQRPEITIDWTVGLILSVTCIPAILYMRRWW